MGSPGASTGSKQEEESTRLRKIYCKASNIAAAALPLAYGRPDDNRKRYMPVGTSRLVDRGFADLWAVTDAMMTPELASFIEYRLKEKLPLVAASARAVNTKDLPAGMLANIKHAEAWMWEEPHQFRSPYPWFDPAAYFLMLNALDVDLPEGVVAFARELAGPEKASIIKELAIVLKPCLRDPEQWEDHLRRALDPLKKCILPDTQCTQPAWLEPHWIKKFARNIIGLHFK